MSPPCFAAMLVVAAGLISVASCSPTRPSLVIMGESWSMIDPNDPGLAGVAIDVTTSFDRFVAAGHDGPALKLWVADERGSAWTAIPATNVERPIQAVADLSIVAGAPGLLVIGQSQLESPFKITAWLSIDAAQWDSVKSPAFDAPKDLYLADAIWANDKFVAVGTAPKESELGRSDALVLSSADGRHWLRNTDSALISDAALTMEAIGLDGSTIVAAGHVNFEGTETFVSEDGTATWQAAKPKAFHNATVKAIVDSPDGLLFGGCTDGVDDASGEFRAAMWLAPNGISGPITKHPVVDRGPNSCVMALSASASSYTAVGYIGDRAAVWTSNDGANWTRAQVNGLDIMKDAELIGVTSGSLEDVAVGAGSPPMPSGSTQTTSAIMVVSMDRQ